MLSYLCPKCGSSVQKSQTIDQDDKVIAEKLICKRNNGRANKKGCGYERTVK